LLNDWNGAMGRLRVDGGGGVNTENLRFYARKYRGKGKKMTGNAEHKGFERV